MFAALVASALAVSGLTLSGTTAQGGRLFALDSWALVGVGLLLGLVALTPLRIRVVATMNGIRVHNLVGSVAVPWAAVRSVRYARGAPCASLELTTGDLVAVLAVQFTDGHRAVEAIRALRAVHTLTAVASSRREGTGGRA